MSSRTVATAIHSPNSHEERFQRVGRATQERPVEAVPVAGDGGHCASEDHGSHASVRCHLEATEPLRPAALRAAFVTLDTIVLPDSLKGRPYVMKSVLHFLKGPFRNALRLALEEEGSSGKSGAGNCCCCAHACCCSVHHGTVQLPRTSCMKGSGRLPEVSV